MGLAMQQVVRRIADERRIDIAVRIGVHTGRCTGGIIGTVRFHFDMWGAAVYGAVKMEETGEKGRVHVSDATYPLIAERFETTEHLGESELGDMVAGVVTTYLIDLEKPLPAHSNHNALMKMDMDDDADLVSDRARRKGGPGGPHGRHDKGQLRLKHVGGLVAAASKFSTFCRSMGGSRRQLPVCRSHDGHPLDRSDRDGRVSGASVDEEDPELAEEDRATSMNFFVQEPASPSGVPSLNPLAAGRASQAAYGPGGVASRASTAGGNRFSTRPGGAAFKGRDSQRKKPSAMARGAAQPATSSTAPRATAAATSDGLSASARAPGRAGPGVGSTEYMNGVICHPHVGSPHGTSIVKLPITPQPPPPPPDTAFTPAQSPRARAASDQRTPGNLGGGTHSAVVHANLQRAAETHAASVRILFTESVRSALRRSAFATTLVLCGFGAFDWVFWSRGPAPTTAFFFMRYIGAAAAAFPTFVLAFMRHLKGQQLPLINLLLLFFPWLFTLALVFMAPNRSRQYMLTLALFQAWSGYTMLSLPTGNLACLQIFLSGIYCITEYVVTDFDGANEYFRPDFRREPSTQELDNSTMVIYIIGIHVLGILHNRRRRRNLRNHAKLLVTQDDRMARINHEVDMCQDLLANVFPAPVLERLQARGESEALAAPDGGKRIFAESFTECTFLFAKIVGLNDLIKRGEEGDLEPKTVVSALQLVFDRFDQLADTFKVQKVRKTVNEYYMVAAGLPDPEVLVGARERALAITALAFSMVHVMDILNSEQLLRELGVTLQAQVGIHSGSAIAGIIGHKRFQYDLCGDAVNTAARMCSYSEPGCINVSPTTLALVADEYGCLYRGERAVKGKGNMALYFLTGRINTSMRELLQSTPISLAGGELLLPPAAPLTPHTPALMPPALRVEGAAPATDATAPPSLPHTNCSSIDEEGSTASRRSTRAVHSIYSIPGDARHSVDTPGSSIISDPRASMDTQGTERRSVGESYAGSCDSINSDACACRVSPTTSAFPPPGYVPRTVPPPPGAPPPNRPPLSRDSTSGLRVDASTRDSDVSEVSIGGRGSAGGASISLDEFSSCADPTVRAMSRQRSTSWAQLGSSIRSMVRPMSTQPTGRSRGDSRARQWDPESLDGMAAAAASGAEIETDVPGIDGAFGERERSPSQMLRSLSMGIHPRYSQANRGATEDTDDPDVAGNGWDDEESDSQSSAPRGEAGAADETDGARKRSVGDRLGQMIRSPFGGSSKTNTPTTGAGESPSPVPSPPHLPAEIRTEPSRKGSLLHAVV